MNHQEKFVFVVMLVPDEFALELDQLDVLSRFTLEMDCVMCVIFLS